MIREKTEEGNVKTEDKTLKETPAVMLSSGPILFFCLFLMKPIGLNVLVLTVLAYFPLWLGPQAILVHCFRLSESLITAHW